MERRNVIGAGLMTGLGSFFAAAPAEAAAAAAAADDDQVRTARGIEDLRKSFERRYQEIDLGRNQAVARVRRQQRDHLKTAQKYPDFIEVGIDIWEGIYDWHVLHQLPVNTVRLADGRYAMTFMYTTLLLRPDQAPEYVGFPFDNK